MPEHKSYLCVGGPWFGKRYYAQEDRDWFEVAVAPKLSAADFQPYGDPTIKSVTITRVRYKRSKFFCDTENVVSFWVPDDQSPLETLQTLLRAYEEFHK